MSRRGRDLRSRRAGQCPDNGREGSREAETLREATLTEDRLLVGVRRGSWPLADASLSISKRKAGQPVSDDPPSGCCRSAE